jgi:hypothetical protein
MSGGRTLSTAERVIAVCLSIVWIGLGCANLYFSVREFRWFSGAMSLLAIAYGIAWTRVAAFSRLLTWPNLFAPWRSRSGGR